jgi:dienelactone hydrolase
MRTPTLVLALTLVAPLAGAAQPPAQDLDLFAPDGTRLRATYWSAEKPGPAVLLLHMCNSQRRAWAGLGPRLAASGIHALALDYRGYGESGGGPLPEGFQEQARLRNEVWPGDVDAAFTRLRQLSGAEALGAAGGSCGVHMAVGAASRHREIRALVLLAGTTDRRGEQFLERSPWLPVFAAAARDDGNAVEMTRWVQGFSAHPDNRFAEYADGGHGTEIFARHADLEPAIAAWFERWLVRGPVPEPPAPATRARGASAEAWAELRTAGGAAALRARLAAARRQGRDLPMPPEGAINGLGYELLLNGDAPGAIEIFALNAELHPESANTYDSLADAQLAAGDRAAALASCEKGLSLLPADASKDAPGLKAIRDALQAKLADLRKPAG